MSKPLIQKSKPKPSSLKNTPVFKMATEPVELTNVEVETILENAKQTSQRLAEENPFLLPDYVRGIQIEPIVSSGSLEV